MEHGTLWGHGAYLGPDYTAEYLHRLAEIGRDELAQASHGKPFSGLPLGQALEIGERLKLELKQNRYQPGTGILLFTAPEAASWRIQAGEWRDYFNGAKAAPGLPGHYIKDAGEIQRLNDYFAWATWATIRTFCSRVSRGMAARRVGPSTRRMDRYGWPSCASTE